MDLNETTAVISLVPRKGTNGPGGNDNGTAILLPGEQWHAFIEALGSADVADYFNSQVGENARKAFDTIQQLTPQYAGR